MPAYKYLIALVCYIITSANAIHILGIFPLGARSHFSFNHAILKSLYAAGHRITMISPFPPEVDSEKFTYIELGADTTLRLLNQSTPKIMDSMSATEMMELATELEVHLCHDVLEMKEIQEILSSTEKLYDVMMVELLMTYQCYLPIAKKLGIPVIGTISTSIWKQASDAVGMPNDPAVIPSDLAASKPDMNFFERLLNVWNVFILDGNLRKVKAAGRQFYHQYFPEYLHLKEDIPLVFFNNHPSLIPRSIPPNAIEIGGIHVQAAKELPKNIQEFIDEAPSGVVLFSLGSIAKASLLPEEKMKAFLGAFASIPQKVIWKFEEPIENLPKNIMISKWLPQRDILEHKNVRAFMSHCGQSGVYEALVTGTPVVTIPLFADQMTNAAFLHWRKVGVNLDMKTVTKESVLEALNTIINDTSYYQRMRKLSDVFRDRPMTPQESVAYWTEYVVRHEGAPHLKALGADMPMYQYLMLDIIASVFVISSIAIMLVYILVKKLHRLFLGGPQNPTPLKKRN